jgi:MarR family transcriptional regulator, organic hydroperoxide resistance regulator
MDEIANCVGPALGRHQHAHHRYIHPKMRALGIFRGQSFVLFKLLEFPGVSQVDLARHVHVQPPTLARTLTRLQETGFVAREVDPEDHRINRLSLTDQGETVVEKLKAVRDMEKREVFSVLSAKEQKQLCSLLDRISDRYESMVAESKE